MKIMLLIAVIIISVSNGNMAEDPQTTCLGMKPFKSKDNSCSDFTDICIKKDDPECQSFLKTCEQCPPSNMTISTLLAILNNFNDKHEQSMAAINLLKQQIYIEQNGSKNIAAGVVLALLIVIIILIVSLMVVLLVEVRYKLITKTCEKYRHGSKMNYRVLKRKKYLPENCNAIDSSAERLQNFENKIESGLGDISDQIKILSNTHHSVFNFQIEGREIPIKLYVDPNDNILQIKRQLCFIVQDRELDYRIMKLSYNDQLMDDNAYLLPLDPPNSIINCKMDLNANLRDIVVLKLDGNIRVPRSIQVLRDQTVDEVRRVISRVINFTEIVLFRKLKNMAQLQGELTVGNSNLGDNCTVTVISRQNGVLVIHFIFENTDPMVMEYTNVELISDLKLKISNKRGCNVDEFSLFSNNGYLAEEKYLFECCISNGSDILYCSVIKSDELQGFQQHCEGMLSTVYRATYTKIDDEIILKRYNVTSRPLLTECKALLSEMKKCQKTNGNPCFVKVYGLHLNKNYVDIAMELMKGQSMRDLVDLPRPLNEIKIAKWSKQILESLKFLHDHKFVHRNMKASDIFIDSEDNIKISGFGLSKYFMGAHKKQMEELFAREPSEDRFAAPEISTGEEYATSADVWSFGEILLTMVTNKPPYSNKTIQERQDDIHHHRDITFDSPSGLSPGLKSFLDRCLKGNKKDRATVEELLAHTFIQNL